MVSLTVLLASPARAQLITPDEPFQEDGMCQDMTGNWVMCDSMGEDGMSGGGSAPGMNSCTSTKGCKKCAIPDGQNREVCVTELYANGYCKCGTTSEGGCVSSGACTYVGG
jgi:hypothetical protein